MADATIIAEIVELVRSKAKLAPTVIVQPDSRLVDDLGIDSLDLVGVFVEMQDIYGVVIEDDRIPTIRRVSDLTALVTAHRGSAAA